MSKVNVTVKEFFTAPANVLVTVTSVLIGSLNVVSGSSGILPGTQSKRTDSFGVAQFDLGTGRFEVVAVSSLAGVSGLRYRELIDVPDDNATYEHTELIVDGAGTFTPVIGNGSPDAAEGTAGLVKLAAGADLEAVPRVLYTKAQVDALVGGGGGLKRADTVALIKAVASAVLKAAGGAIVWGGAAAGDGQGGIYRFKDGGAEADEGIGGRYLRPDDYAGAGVNQGTLEKFI